MLEKLALATKALVKLVRSEVVPLTPSVAMPLLSEAEVKTADDRLALSNVVFVSLAALNKAAGAFARLKVAPVIVPPDPLNGSYNPSAKLSAGWM